MREKNFDLLRPSSTGFQPVQFNIDCLHKLKACADGERWTAQAESLCYYSMAVKLQAKM